MRSWAAQKAHEKLLVAASRREWLQDLCDSDKNMLQISMAIGLNPSAFSKMCKAHGVSPEAKQKRILTREVMQSAFDRSLTLIALCAETGVTRQAVEAAEKRENIHLPRHAGRKIKLRKRQRKAKRKVEQPKLTPLERSALETKAATRRVWG